MTCQWLCYIFALANTEVFIMLKGRPLLREVRLHYTLEIFIFELLCIIRATIDRAPFSIHAFLQYSVLFIQHL